MNIKTPDAVLKALEHVHTLHPEVTHVLFNANGEWLYFDDEFNNPSFGDSQVDVGILEDAAGAVEDLPSVFCWESV